ncbi:ComEC/Rec2 family competence protein [Muriicola soli]|uniref:ComEC family competence protein n=1 Tax=Muriicola soli TaxID=2507538 RepID=A0A411EC44_9FLAO|nr:ComEC/Rec2 family competence protein [Muriicola soli]QBA65010.1 ComEC family competence protein [Muriicola soli]
MKPLEFISVKLSLCLILGICYGWISPLSPGQAIFTSISSILCVLLFFQFENYRKGIYFGIATLLAFFLIGVVTITLAQPKLTPNHYSNKSYSEKGYWVLELKEVLKPTPFRQSYLFRVVSFNDRFCEGLILGSTRKEYKINPLKVDDRLLYYGNIHPVSSPQNPYQFNYGSYMETKGVYDQITLRSENTVQLPAGKSSLHGLAAQLQFRIKDALASSLIGSKEQGVLRAIVLGQRNDLDPGLYQNYKDAGAAHILAVSGLHIGILLLMLRAFFKPIHSLPKGRKISMLLTVLFLWAYALFTGLSPSVVRAVSMFSFIAYAMYLNRPTSAINVLALSFSAILLVEPKFLFQLGFQLSYSAVFAIGWIYPLIIRSWVPRNPILIRLYKLFAVSLAAQVGVLPLCLYYFHQFPTAFFITAMLIVPFLGLFLSLGILVILLSGLSLLPEFLALIYDQMIRTMNLVVELIASQENLIIRNVPFDKPSLILLYSIIILLVLSLYKKRFIYVYFLGMSIIGLQVWSFYCRTEEGKREEIIILQQVANTGLVYQKGRELLVMTHDSTKIKNLVKNFELNRYLDSVRSTPLPNAFRIGKERWAVIDSAGILPEVFGNLRGLILTQSPKVHLGRILEQSCPERVIADGSNFPDEIKRWKRTCRTYGIPFYSTAEEGAITLGKL